MTSIPASRFPNALTLIRICKRNGNLVLGTDYTDYMDFKKISCICHSERSEESPERTRRCFTTFSMTKEIRDQSVQSVPKNSPINYHL